MAPTGSVRRIVWGGRLVSIDSKRWRLRVFNDALAQITQRASNESRYCFTSKLPSADALASMSENRFDAIMREAFHNATR